MKIDTTKIENFDGMTDAEKINALLGYDVEEKPSTDSTEVAKLKAALNKASSETADYKKQLREKQSEAERMAAEQKEQADKMLEELNSLKHEKTVAEHLSKLVGLGFEAQNAKSSAEALADGNMEDFYKGLGTFIENHDKSIKANVLKQTPPPANGFTGDKSSVITKEQFNAMTYGERVKLQTENPTLYAELNK